MGLTPLLYEGSSQAEFLRPTVITLVYGLGFGMVLVLLLVPAVLAVQADLEHQITAIRRGLKMKSGPATRARLLLSGAVLAVAALFATTIGTVAVTGALPPVWLAAVPPLVGKGAMVSAFALFMTGTVGVLVLTYLAGLLVLRPKSRKAG